MKLVYNIDIVFNKKTSLDLTGFFYICIDQI